MNSSIASKCLLGVLNFYKRFISPLLIPACRFTPTCSEYMMQAVSRYGALRGFGKGCWRILRCNPFCKGGFDPVQ